MSVMGAVPVSLDVEDIMGSVEADVVVVVAAVVVIFR